METTVERVQVAVTPPGGMDSPMFRRFVEDKAREQGFVDLVWEDGEDRSGQWCARLFGVRKPSDGEA